MWYIHALWPLALVFLRLASADNAPCTAHDGDDYYDLSRLQSKYVYGHIPTSSSTDYEFQSASGRGFVINVCKPVSTELWRTDIERPEDIGGFTRRERDDFSIGSVMTTSLLVRNGHPLLIMSDGSRCPQSDNMTASTAIRFICDTSIFGEDPGDSVATIFMLYILVGTFYNRYVLELRGFDQIPRISIWSFDEIRDRLHRVMNRSGSGAGRRGSGYEGVAEEEQAIMGGPTGWLEEQDAEGAQEQAAQQGRPPPAGGMDPNGVIRLTGQVLSVLDITQRICRWSSGTCFLVAFIPLLPLLFLLPASFIQTTSLDHRRTRPPRSNEPPQYGRTKLHAPILPNVLLRRRCQLPLRAADASLSNRAPWPCSSAGRRSRGRSLSDDEDMGVDAEKLANTRKEATRRQRIEAEQRRRDELRDGYARLKEVLPVSNQKSSKVSLLERACNHIEALEKNNRQLQERLHMVEQEVARLRTLNEKISLGGVGNTPSPGQVNMDARPLSPPPEEPPVSQHQLASVAGQDPPAECSPTPDNGY
ncbi:hypothetical protein WOLCODRAFT_63513 [Wolfiporia cocos MD-104 SS10]|uniref:BHLH domain-containing protein n=1 Tax=Wolfiporia cocos (strain MD-104) TaxID=742152 RepID=A0A2H3IVW8_WOLCO|nr:hypothetical protein WOLCODRAFT_63513 [Wolfiporia cocos MD-104 SS10]